MWPLGVGIGDFYLFIYFAFRKWPCGFGLWTRSSAPLPFRLAGPPRAAPCSGPIFPSSVPWRVGLVASGPSVATALPSSGQKQRHPPRRCGNAPSGPAFVCP